MQVLGSNFNSKNNDKADLKKYLIIGMIACAVLIVFILVFIGIYSKNRPKILTLTIDGAQVQIPNGMFKFEGENVYISLEDIGKGDMARLVGYRYVKGGYKQFANDDNICYLEGDNEIATYKLNSDLLYKTLNNGIIEYSEYSMSAPVKRIDDKLYVISDGLATGCNFKFYYNPQTQQIVINTLPYYFKTYKDKATTEYKYEGVDEEFVNQKAVLYGMMVVKENGQFGVITLENKTCVSARYDKIEFVETVSEFFVTASRKMGVITDDGKIKITPYYDKIKLLDNNAKLYYVENNGRKGVLNRSGAILGKLYTEYDQIGINATLFPTNDIKNEMLLYDNCIPVRLANKWGIFNIEGEEIVGFNWDGLGCALNTSKDKISNNILLVPSIEGIVVCNNNKYGIINSTGKLLVPCVFDRIYSETTGGQEVYYVRFENQTITLDEYLKDKGIISDNQTTTSGNNGDDEIDLTPKTPKPDLDTQTPNSIVNNTPSPTPTQNDVDTGNDYLGNE